MWGRALGWCKLDWLVFDCRRRFKQLPIGPIGAHLTLTDTKWAVAGEVALGGMLETWIVDNKDDNKVGC